VETVAFARYLVASDKFNDARRITEPQLLSSLSPEPQGQCVFMISRRSLLKV
jgi:hypothetical protein